MTSGWTWFVIILVAINILGCVWLLWWTARRRPGDPKPEDTSHVWDGDITEYNKPLPKWWINLFYLTILFAIGQRQARGLVEGLLAFRAPGPDPCADEQHQQRPGDDPGDHGWPPRGACRPRACR